MSNKEKIITGLVIVAGLAQLLSSLLDSSYEIEILKTQQNGTVMLEAQNNFSQTSHEFTIQTIRALNICEESPNSPICSSEKEILKKFSVERTALASTSSIFENKYIKSVNVLADKTPIHEIYTGLLSLVIIMINVLILIFLYKKDK